MRYTILIITLLITAQIISGQKPQKSVGIGFGIYQGYHISADYFYTENLSIGASIGSHFSWPPGNLTKHYSIAIENKLHFGDLYETGTKPWYFGQQIMYWILDEGVGITYKTISISPTIGLNLAFSKRISVVVDIGPSVNLVVDTDKSPDYVESSFLWPLFFNARGQIVYRF